MPYTLLFPGLLLAATAAIAAGLPGPAMLLFPLPVAMCWARRQPGRALGLVGGAALAALLATGAPGAAVVFAAVASLGVVLGEMAARRAPFGVAVAALTGATFGFCLASLMGNWAASREQGIIFLQARLALLEEAGRIDSAAQAELGRWMETHYGDLLFGTLFGSVLAMAALAVAVMRRWAALRAPEAGIQGTFARMRPPEWLVWVAIAVALAWIAESRWPNDALRAVAWNGAMALVFVYALNGFGILLYALHGLQASPLLAYAALLAVLLFLVNSLPLLAFAGFFDTWWSLRGKVDRLAAARRERDQGGDPR